MLLIIFFGLIVKLASVSDGCDVGTSVVNNFDWDQVGIVVLTRLLKQAAFKTAALVLYFICAYINELSIQHIRITMFE